MEISAPARIERKSLLFIGSVKLLGTFCSVHLFSGYFLIPGLNSDLPSGNAGPQLAGAVLSEGLTFFERPPSGGSRTGALDCQRSHAGVADVPSTLGHLSAMVWNIGIIESMGRRRQTVERV